MFKVGDYVRVIKRINCTDSTVISKDTVLTIDGSIVLEGEKFYSVKYKGTIYRLREENFELVRAIKSIDPKYEFTGNTCRVNGKILHQIKALRDFGFVKKGQIGGFIESEHNLAHYGNCWVEDCSCVFDDAQVVDNAIVNGKSLVHENAYVADCSKVSGNVIVSGSSRILEHAQVKGSLEISGDSLVAGHASVYGEDVLVQNANIEDSCEYAYYDIRYPHEMHIAVYLDNQMRVCINDIGSKKVMTLSEFECLLKKTITDLDRVNQTIRLLRLMEMEIREGRTKLLGSF